MKERLGEVKIDRAVGEGVVIESGNGDVAVAAVAVVIILRHWVVPLIFRFGLKKLSPLSR